MPYKSKSSSVSFTSRGSCSKSSGQKFYAVRNGYKTGIYTNYQDCKRQIHGYTNAKFKSFKSLAEAQKYLSQSHTDTSNLTSPSYSSPNPNSTNQKWYAVQSGRHTGIYSNWSSAQDQVRGWPNAKFKSFSNPTDAQVYLNSSKSSNINPTLSTPLPQPNNPNPFSSQPGTGLLSEDAIDGFDNRIILDKDSGTIKFKTPQQLNATKLAPTGKLKNNTLDVYTDGAGQGNGTQFCRAGVGVYFGPGDSRNLSERLPGSRQTNQRAELHALSRALDMTPLNTNVRLLSDSSYSIKCVTEWYKNWERNRWMTSNNKPVENRDLIENVLQKVKIRERVGVTTDFVWVKGHANVTGNIEADRLATESLKNPPID